MKSRSALISGMFGYCIQNPPRQSPGLNYSSAHSEGP